MKLRFVQGKDLTSIAIIIRSEMSMPLCPSHVECVTPEGKYLGQHADGGMQARDPGYDKEWFGAEYIAEVDATKSQDEKFYDFMESKIGQPYDIEAIAGFMLPGHHHQYDHSICSAIVTLGLRAAEIWKWPLAVPAHLIMPRDVLLMLSGIMKIDH